MHTDNAFVNLTYSNEHMPRLMDGRGNLVPKDLQDWLKRHRKAFSKITGGKTFRFFAAGEYGDKTERPHFHVILFGYPTCRYGQSRYGKVTVNCCPVCDLVRDTWTHGGVFLGTVTTDSAQYTCGYVTKKMTSKDDFRLKGRHPEFSRMSLKPGIGGDAMWDVASTVLEFDLETPEGDVPSSLQHGTRKLPLGRYLQRRLRKMVGKDEKAPQAVLDKLSAELHPLREAAFNASQSFAKEIVKSTEQAALNQEERVKIFKQRRDKL